MQKLELNAGKCHQIHVGKSNEYCTELNAHSKIMEEVKSDKYLR